MAANGACAHFSVHSCVLMDVPVVGGSSHHVTKIVDVHYDERATSHHIIDPFLKLVKRNRREEGEREGGSEKEWR